MLRVNFIYFRFLFSEDYKSMSCELSKDLQAGHAPKSNKCVRIMDKTTDIELVPEPTVSEFHINLNN